MDPLELRIKNVASIGVPTIAGPKHAHAGFMETLQALKAHPAYANPPKGANQGRGVAVGYWFNGGGESSATMQINADGTVLVATGSPDIGGSRASMALMAAETLGVDYNLVRAIVADTGSIGYTHVTGGSRVTFATGMAVVDATKNVIKDLIRRAAMIWDVDPEGVIWEDGFAKPAGANVGNFKPMSVAEIAGKAAATGGPITATAGVNAGAQAPGFGAHFVDVEVDPETGRVDILKYVAAQDVGKAIHPSYVEGQIQGGVVQGIGWALNEEYIYSAKGLLDNAGFLDYRCPVASDLPMIDTILVEVPNPVHPYGAKGVGEVNICPPMAAIANAIESATHARMTHLPMSPPRVLATMSAGK
jgi:CO/xanthine dehydrogenase Mo-binding subunit